LHREARCRHDSFADYANFKGEAGMNHSFDIRHAEQYGVIEAVLIANFQFWIVRNRADGENFRNGRTWTYNSVRAYALLFPYLSRDQVRRAIDRLVAAEVLMVGNYNDKATDQTKWFAFHDEVAFLPAIPDISSHSDLANLPNAIGKSASPVGNSANSLINTDVNTDVNLERTCAEKAKKGTRLTDDWVLPKKYGEWALAQYPDWTPAFIRERGVKFRNHWSGVPGKAGCKTNWFGAWSNFCLTEAEFITRTTRTPGTSVGGMPWWFSDASTIAEGAKRGVKPFAGESMRALRARIQNVIEEAHKAGGVAPGTPVAPPPAAPDVSAHARDGPLSADAVAARKAEIGRALDAARRATASVGRGKVNS
jgi:hypothetical protein